MNAPVLNNLKIRLVKHVRNAGDIWDAWIKGTCPPPIILRSGITIYHAWPTDPIYFLLDEIFIKELYTRDGFYTPKDDNFVVDVGANIGLFSLFLANQSSGIEVRCFEAVPSTFERLQRNIDSNDLRNRIKPFHVAVWNTACDLTIAEHKCSARSSGFLFPTEDNDVVQSVQVRSNTLAELLSTDERPIDMLKIDVEGSELEVLLGIDSPLWDKIRRVVIEYHDTLRPGMLTMTTTLLSIRGFHCSYDNCSVLSDEPGLLRAYR